MFKEGRIRKDPAELLKAPKIEKKAPVILSVNEVNALLDQPGMTTSKEIRDKAMLEQPTGTSPAAAASRAILTLERLHSIFSPCQ